MVEVEYGEDVADVRLVPLPDGRVVLVTGDEVSSFDGAPTYSRRMCRNIRPLHNFEPPASSDEVAAAALQFVRKVSGTTKPSQANQAAFDHAVREIAHITRHLLDELVTDRAAEEPRGRGGEAPGAGGAQVRPMTPVGPGRAGSVSLRHRFDVRRP